MRRANGGIKGAVAAYPRQLESLIRLAEAHAKMRWSHVVEVNHSIVLEGFPVLYSCLLFSTYSYIRKLLNIRTYTVLMFAIWCLLFVLFLVLPLYMVLVSASLLLCFLNGLFWFKTLKNVDVSLRFCWCYSSGVLCSVCHWSHVVDCRAERPVPVHCMTRVCIRCITLTNATFPLPFRCSPVLRSSAGRADVCCPGACRNSWTNSLVHLCS